MRYVVRYDRDSEKWAVVDTAVADQMIGVHKTADAAVDQAFGEQELWRRYDPTVIRMARLLA